MKKILLILAITGLMMSFEISTTTSFYITGYGRIDSTDTVIIQQLPLESGYFIVSYGNSPAIIYASDTLSTAIGSWDTVEVAYRFVDDILINCNDRVLIFTNDTTGNDPLILDNEERILEGIDRYIGQLIFYTADTTRIIINQISNKIKVR